MRSGIKDLPCLLKILFIGFSSSALSGCIPIPIKTGHTPPSEYNRNINDQTRFSLEIGKTSRKEVLLKLGEPDKVLDDQSTFIYEAESTKGGDSWALLLLICGPGACVPAGGGPFGAGVEYEGCRLIVNFDEQGLVRGHHFERFKRVGRQSGTWEILK